MKWGGSRILSDIGTELLKNSTINPMTQTRAGNWGKAIGTGLETAINRNRQLAMMQAVMGGTPTAPNLLGDQVPDGQVPMPGAAQSQVPPAIRKMAQMRAFMGDPYGAVKMISDYQSAAALKGIPPAAGPLNPSQYLTENQRWDRIKAPVWDAVQSYQVVKDLEGKEGAGILDYGILIKAIKALDPTSAVMAGEATAAQAMVSLQDKFYGTVERLKKGGLVAKKARGDLVELARTAADVALRMFEKKRLSREDVYKAANMDPGQIGAILKPLKPGWWNPEEAGSQLPGDTIGLSSTTFDWGERHYDKDGKEVVNVPGTDGTDNWVYKKSGAPYIPPVGAQ